MYTTRRYLVLMLTLSLGAFTVAAQQPIEPDITTLQQNATAGDTGAQNTLGDKYLTGEGVAKDYAQAFFWFHKAAEQGNGFAQDRLGSMCQLGWGTPRDNAQALSWYHKAADHGTGSNADAEFSLGLMYLSGFGTLPNYAEARRWLQLAANRGVQEAKDRLAKLDASPPGMSFPHINVSQSPQSLATLQAQASAGDVSAENKIGSYYLFGEGVPQDLAKAFNWLHKAAAQGDSSAEFQVGQMYFYGSGVNQDTAQGLVWLRKSAEKGNVSAQSQLGLIYANNLQDYAQALVWYRKAADQGYARSQFSVGAAYESGNGVSQDLNEARRWFQLAANQGDQSAKDELARLGPPPAPDTIQAAQSQNNPVDTSADDEAEAKKEEIDEKINDLESDIEELQHEVETWQNSVEQLSNCSGVGAAICEAGAAKAQSNANKANNQIDEKRRQIARLQGEEGQETVKRSTDAAAIYASRQTPQAGNSQPPSSNSSAGSPTNLHTCRNMTYCAQVVSTNYDANHVLHVVVKNNCGSRIRITTSIYAHNRNCTVGQTANFNPGDSQDMGDSTDRTWYRVQADDSVMSSVDGTGCKLVVPNSCY